MRIDNRWSILVTNTHCMRTPKKKDICGANPELLDAYDHLVFQWTSMEDLINSFSHMFTDLVRYDNVPAVNTVFRNGIQAYADLLKKDEKHYYPHERLKTFLTGCFSSAKDTCRFVVVDKKAGERWSLGNEVPLSLWRSNRENLEVEYFEIDKEDFSQLLYSKVLPNNMKLAMRRFNHETAIVGGDLDNCH